MHAIIKSYKLIRLVEIFQMPHEQISWIYKYLRCEYHLVQDEDRTKAPTIPALTPLGFDQWITLFVLAYPNEESERLQIILETTPIDADGALDERKPVRLPKQLSRHLLPLQSSDKPWELLEYALPSFKDLATSSQTSPKIPIVTARTPSVPKTHHDDTYSMDSSTSKNHYAELGSQKNLPHKRHVRFRNSTCQRKENPIVHNTK
jgi:hypothetical protein